MAELTATVLETPDLAGIDPRAWDRLSAAALFDNPYYGRQHLLGSLETIARDSAVSALALHSACGRLRALLPYRTQRHPPFAWRVATAFTHPYQSSSAPLIDAETAPAAIRTWFGLLGEGRLPAFWAMADLDTASPLTRLLAQVAAESSRQIHAVGSYVRPRLTRVAGGLEAHLDNVVPRDRLKRTRRNLRRLREQGEVSFERAREPVALRRRLEQFLALEHAGWKGRRGTSLLARAATAEFARRCYGGEAGREGLAFIDSLLLDGQPIAMALNVAAGSTAYSPKSAYDETWRSYGPGLVLDYLAVERFYEDDGFTAFDAATTVDGHVLSELWNEQRPMARLVVGPADQRTAMLASGFQGLHELRGASKHALAVASTAAAPLTGLARRVAAALGTVVAAVCVVLPDMVLGLKRHEWAVAPLAGAI